MALTCFCGAPIDRQSRCPGCGGPISVSECPDHSSAMARQVVGSFTEADDPQILLAILALNAGPLPADKAVRNGALFARIERLRADMRSRLEVIEALAARGVPKQELFGCHSDDEVKMDAAICALRVFNQRHAEAMAELRLAPTDADADAPADAISALARDIYEALRGNGYQTYDDLAAHFGTNVPRVVLAVKQLELAGERTGARIIRYQSGAEIDELAQQPEPGPRAIPIRAANSIAAIPVRQVPGQRGFYGVHRGSRLRQGTLSIEAAAKRLVELGVRTGRAV